MKVGFLGGGAMGGAMMRGFVAQKIAAAEDICFYEPSTERSAQLCKECSGVQSFRSAADVVLFSNVIIIAVKPDVVASVLTTIQSTVPECENSQNREKKLVVSIAAGITINTMEESISKQARCVRVMPNVACLVGQSSSGYALGKDCSADDAAVVEQLLGAVGRVFRVAEKDMDAVTGLSGSGPAYVCEFIEALADGGVRSGLPRDVALAMAVQTVLGTAAMLKETGQHPAVMKDSVCSPGGTTITGVHELEKGAFRGTIMNAVYCATMQSKYLGQPK
eukprot:ANDGO_01386.mRNA.1 Pyrroline-5-carboxylate reductase